MKPQLGSKGLLMVVSHTVVRVFWGNEIPPPPLYLNLTSFLPQFYLFSTSSLPFLNLNLTSGFVTNLEPRFGATKMTGRPGHWSEPGEYNILFLGSILVISSQDSSALGYREFTQEGPMTISPFAAREGTSAPQWPNVKKCCRHLVPSSDLFVQSYAVPRKLHLSSSSQILNCLSNEMEDTGQQRERILPTAQA